MADNFAEKALLTIIGDNCSFIRQNQIFFSKKCTYQFQLLMMSKAFVKCFLKLILQFLNKQCYYNNITSFSKQFVIIFKKIQKKSNGSSDLIRFTLLSFLFYQDSSAIYIQYLDFRTFFQPFSLCYGTVFFVINGNPANRSHVCCGYPLLSD